MRIPSIRREIISGIIAMLGLWFIIPEEIYDIKITIKIRLLFTLVITGATLLKILIIKNMAKRLEQQKEEDKRKKE